MVKKLVVLIEASGRYCNNLCQFMTPNSKHCNLFGVDLQWKTGKRWNGNIRPKECRKAELHE